MCVFKKCKVNNCIDRCHGWFPNNVQLRDGCAGACGNDHKTLNSANDYVCSGNYVDEQSFILAYGYDPCEGGASLGSIQDGWANGSPTRQLQSGVMKFLAVAGVLMFVTLVGLIIYKSKS